MSHDHANIKGQITQENKDCLRMTNLIHFYKNNSLDNCIQYDLKLLKIYQNLLKNNIKIKLDFK